MESDPNFRELGSAMGWVYADWFGRPYDAGHYYLYVPEKRSSGAMPVILFFHGSFGNFKAYTWVWSHLADEMEFVLVAPSYGFGEWGRLGGIQAALKALEEAGSQVELDEKRVYLAGLSNGGLGVTSLAAIYPERFRGLIFLSPVMAESVDQRSFHEHWAGRPVLVVTGETDERIPVKYVSDRVGRMLSGGVAVEYITFPGEDHFLFFSQRTRVLNAISEWLNRNNY
jgi:pimeloyl-ACP methyl ester carboxylesterase